MIAREVIAWVKSVNDCFPRYKTARLKERLARAESAAPGGRWQIGVGNSDFFAVPEFRRFGRNSAAGFPAEAFRWDLKTGAPGLSWRYAGPRARGAEGEAILYDARPFTRQLFQDEALAAVFGDFSALCPISHLITEWDAAGGRKRARSGWRLRLAPAVPWPRFCRLNMADSFLKRYSYLSYLFLDRRVAELAFDGDHVRAYLGA